MAKQQDLPTLERTACKEVDEAADVYEGLRDRRMRAGEKEVEAKATLLAAMKKHKLKKYRLDEERYVEVTEEEGVKVRKVRPAGKEEE